MEELVRLIATSLVDSPDQVQVSSEERENEVRIELRVAEGDMGKVIGKQGRIAKAIRTVVTAVATRENKVVSIEIIQ
ncbi:MAG: KH domain-containing protein [Clostridiales Family XIII bacterium]|jgi:predicted RNA-binding protein YlqC (UPF0109 family)|nr:KH domain-containing protein [Clostridiales Family XIII bacterium]